MHIIRFLEQYKWVYDMVLGCTMRMTPTVMSIHKWNTPLWFRWTVLTKRIKHGALTIYGTHRLYIGDPYIWNALSTDLWQRNAYNTCSKLYKWVYDMVLRCTMTMTWTVISINKWNMPLWFGRRLLANLPTECIEYRALIMYRTHILYIWASIYGTHQV